MIFLSLRFNEAYQHASLLKQALEAELKVKVYLCSVPEGQSIADDIAENLKKSTLVVIFGTETYGAKTTSSFSTYQEMIWTMDKKKPFFLIKMCPEFKEALTDFYFNSTISYFEWNPLLSDKMPVDLVSRIDGKMKSLQKPDGIKAADDSATRRAFLFGAVRKTAAQTKQNSAKSGGGLGATLDLLQQQTAAFSGYAVDQRVYCNFMRLGMEKLATVQRVNPDGTYDVVYDDSDFENKVEQNRMRALPSVFKPKDKVMANYMNKGSFFPAQIKFANSDSTYDIEYLHDPTLFENKVAAERIRAQTVYETGAEKYFQGQNVFANWMGRGREYKGSIQKVNEDGTCDIKYNDGDFESSVPPSRLRPDIFSFNQDEKIVLATGEEGTITEVFMDGTYSVKLDSGEVKDRCPPSMLRKKAAANAPPASVFTLGQKVLGNWKGYGRVYPGTIVQVNEDGTYNIDYDDGDKEQSVKPADIRDRDAPLPGRTPIPDDTVIVVDMRIQSNWKGGSNVYPGKISKVNEDSTFDIAYDDGDKESSVPRARIYLPSST